MEDDNEKFEVIQEIPNRGSRKRIHVYVTRDGSRLDRLRELVMKVSAIDWGSIEDENETDEEESVLLMAFDEDGKDWLP